MKKRILSIMLTICMAFMLVPNIVFAETTSDGSFEYSVADGAVTITKFKGSDTDVTIPNTIDGYPVKVIGQSAFEDFYSLTSVTVPDGLTGIEKNAFNDCIKLKTINIPDTVKSIGESAFYCCESLTNVTIPLNPASFTFSIPIFSISEPMP